MIETANMLGILAGVLLLMSVVAWVKLVRSPLLRCVDGASAMDSGQEEFASELLLWAAGLSTVAAIVAIVGWIVH